MFSKVLFFTTASVLASCSPPPPEITSSRDPKTEELSSESPSSSEKFRNMDSSREYFRYTFSDCKGEEQRHVDIFNKMKKENFLDIEIEDGEVSMSRPEKKAELNVNLKGKWNHTNNLLTDLSGQFGIGTSEDWSQASGFLYISDEVITGRIDGAKIEFSGLNKILQENVKMVCTASLFIEKKRD